MKYYLSYATLIALIAIEVKSCMAVCDSLLPSLCPSPDPTLMLSPNLMVKKKCCSVTPQWVHYPMTKQTGFLSLVSESSCYLSASHVIFAICNLQAEQQVNRRQGHGHPRHINACGEQRLSCVFRSHRRAIVAQIAEKVKRLVLIERCQSTQCITACCLAAKWSECPC